MASSHYPHGLKSLSPATAMGKVLQRLGGFREVPLEKGSPYVQPASIRYEIDGKERGWDIVKAHPSVGVVLYHSALDAFILVRQFRPAVYAARRRAAEERGGPAPPKDAGFTFELCAGLVDKGGKSLEQIAAEEVEEECGYRVAPSALRSVASAIASSGTTGAEHFIFYAAVDESMRVNPGGGLDGHGEAIEVLALPFSSAPAFVLDSSQPKSPGLMFGLLWARGALASGDVKGKKGGLETSPLELREVLPS
ncbi:uridine diphosphate glucose pyrophosphatase [Raphidocelis subcapitata]|uniref:Uridine diphosphate glucose pyrophosphatase NUDT14 n=1 Tax=Raphidocelis subcapitata TaxID=307507 RepID=A0A2V0PCS3_9CHLO|nr:uridine diphosphate glucose pyrophosphatase [Raphidocelis subcapitata]|eukprot:GBF97651.1 uridine diphosphate glucose pyrophosphatase [Raphidocelis subcapitata]